MNEYTCNFKRTLYTEEGKEFSFTDDSLNYVITVTAEGKGWYVPAKITADPYYSSPEDGEFSVDEKSINIEEVKIWDEELEQLVEVTLTDEQEKLFKENLVDFLEDNEDSFEENTW